MLARFAPLALLPLAACSFASFHGAISIANNRTNLRAIGAFSPDGKSFVLIESALSTRRPETAILRFFRRGPRPDLPAGWRLERKVRLGDLFAIDLAFSPDGRFVAVAGMGRRNNIALWSVRRGKIVSYLPGSAPVTQAVAFGPSSEWLVSAGLDGRVRVWDVSSGRLRAQIADDAALLRQTRFPLVVGRAGAFIAYGRSDGRVVFADPRSGIHLDVRASGGREVYDLAQSPDGKWLAVSSDAGVRLWDLTKPGSPERDLGPERSPAIAFFPDGQTLLASGESPKLSRVVEVPSGKVVYGFSSAGPPARNRGLDHPPTPLSGMREEMMWSRVHRTFPGRGNDDDLKKLVIDYARNPTIHRVAISPENLWVAFFDGGRAGLVITQRHYELRVLSGKRMSPAPTSPSPAPARPLTPAARRRLQESI